MTLSYGKKSLSIVNIETKGTNDKLLFRNINVLKVDTNSSKRFGKSWYERVNLVRDR
jgi:hypothetical protein